MWNAFVHCLMAEPCHTHIRGDVRYDFSVAVGKVALSPKLLALLLVHVYNLHSAERVRTVWCDVMREGYIIYAACILVHLLLVH